MKGREAFYLSMKRYNHEPKDAPERIRTADALLRTEALYPLSYGGSWKAVAGSPRAATELFYQIIFPRESPRLSEPRPERRQRPAKGTETHNLTLLLVPGLAMKYPAFLAALGVAASVLALGSRAAHSADPEPAWTAAHQRPPMSRDETRTFMRRLARYVHDHHLKQTPGSAQRGMVYEYFDPTRKGQFDQFVQGEALDTMHDGAWLAAALVNAHRATGDPFYRRFVAEWQLPFYCKMLNHSDTLFSTKRNDARPGAPPWNREHGLQEGEKGFVPYWWDDGGSVSLEGRRDKDPRPIRPSVHLLIDKPNPNYLLHGYSQGSSNHLAQDLGVMLQQAWLLFKEGDRPADRKLAAELAEAARNLHLCRMNHHGHIPMCCSPTALANGDAEELKRLPDPADARLWTPDNHYTRALYTFAPGERRAFPGFADDQQYRYHHGIARAGGQLPKPLAFKTIYDAYTEPLLYRYYSDDAPVPAGINRFDLHTYYAVDGKLTDYRSDRKGPNGLPRPIGSRMGPQNMICAGWALQALRQYPGLWEERHRTQFPQDVRVPILDVSRGIFNVPGGVSAIAGPSTVNVYSTRTALRVDGDSKEDAITLRLFGKPDAQGRHAIVTLKRDKTATAVNDRGEPLRFRAEITPAEEGFRYYFELPYTVVKEQKAWANGVEHGRLSVQLGDAKRNLYLLSSEADVKAWLEHELAGGLRTWEAIFNEKGYIPTGLGTGAAGWDRYSDSGGYAHLISAASQYLLYLDGKRDWEVHRIPTVAPIRNP